MRLRRLERGLALLLLACVLASGAAISCSVIGLCLPLCARTASGRRALLRRLRALLPLLCGLGIAWGLGLLAADSGGRGLLLARFGLIAARVLAAALLLGWLTHDLSPAQLGHALRRLRVPPSLVELILQTRAFGRQLEVTLQAAWSACALRAGLCSPAALRRSIGSVAGVVVLRSIDRSERVAIARALRGVDVPPADGA